MDAVASSNRCREYVTLMYPSDGGGGAEIAFVKEVDHKRAGGFPANSMVEPAIFWRYEDSR